MPTSIAPTTERTNSTSVGYRLAIIAIAAGLAGLTLAYGIDMMERTARSAPPTGMIVRGIGGVELQIPAAYFRDQEERSEGFTDEINLVAHLPLGAAGRESTVNVTLLPRSRARPSSALLDAVYLHQFAAAQLSGPPGLVGKPLVASEGFSGETVWYDALNADPFVAKCMAPLAPGEPTQCLRTVLYGNVAAVYSFNEDVLVNWRAFDADIAPWLAGMGIH